VECAARPLAPFDGCCASSKLGKKCSGPTTAVPWSTFVGDMCFVNNAHQRVRCVKAEVPRDHLTASILGLKTQQVSVSGFPMTYDHSCAAVLALGLLMFASCAPPALDSSVLLKKPTYDLALTDDDFTGLEGMELTEDDIKVLTPRWDDFDQIIYTLGLVVRENKAQKVREETAAKEQVSRASDLATTPSLWS